MVLLTFCCCSGVAFAQTTAADQQYNVGMTTFRAGNYAAAINQWENLLASYPNYAEKEQVWYMIALAANQTRDYSKAATYYGKIIDQTDAAGQPIRGNYYQLALYELGVTFYNYADQLYVQGEQIKAKTYALQAEQFFNRLCEESPNSPNIPQALRYLTKVAVIYKQSASDTKKYAEKAVQLIPENTSATDTSNQANQDIRSDCLFYYAWALGQLGQSAEARRVFATFIANRDTKRGSTSLYELAYTYYRDGNYLQAISEMSSYESFFPNDQSSKLKIQRLRAMCYFQLEDYTRATQLLEQLIRQTTNPADILVEDYVWLTLCYLKTQRYDAANNYLTDLEREYANTPSSDGIKVLRAAYYYEMQDYAKAVNLINPVLGTRQLSNGQVTFTMRPYNTESKDDIDKCGLSEEHFLLASSLLSLCYAKGGQMNTAQSIYAAMLLVSNELYGRYSSIREKTQVELTKIAQSQPSGKGSGTIGSGNIGSGSIGGLGQSPPLIGSGSGTSNNTPIVIVPGGSGINSGTGNSTWGSSPGSSIQTGGSNSLAYRTLTPEQQEEEISSCASLAKRDTYVDEVLNNLLLLLSNPTMTDYNNARAAVLRGQLLYEKKNDTRSAMNMFELAYDQIVGTPEQDSDTFAKAAYYRGKYAEQSGKYADAAKYYSEAYQTKSGQEGFQDVLLYRWGTSLLNIRGHEREAINCFTKIYRNETTSDYWSLAAVQLAIEDFKAGDYDLCEEIIDDLIAKKPDKAVLDRVLFLKGELALRSKQWEIAAESFDALCVFAGNSDFVGLASQKLSDARNHNAQTALR